MRARVCNTIAIVIIPLLLAACGGGGGDGQSYTLAASSPCLSDVGKTSDTVDIIAESASGGATRVVLNGKEVMVMFGSDGDEADGLAEEYEGVPGGGYVRTSANAVMAWTEEPANDEAQSVEDCLR